MDIDDAIKQLNKFKKLSGGLGKYDLLQMNDDSFIVKIPFKEQSIAKSYKPIIGFCPSKKKETNND